MGTTGPLRGLRLAWPLTSHLAKDRASCCDFRPICRPATLNQTGSRFVSTARASSAPEGSHGAREPVGGLPAVLPEQPYHCSSGHQITKGTNAPWAFGHFRVVYTARRAHWNIAEGRLEHYPESRQALAIIYPYSCVAERDTWLEVKVLCDFARALTEGDKDAQGASMDCDVRPVEYIIVKSRFHYSSQRPDEPWHLSCMVGNRRIWKNGEGYFRDGFHVYANDNSLAHGYQGYSRFNQNHQGTSYQALTSLPAALFPTHYAQFSHVNGTRSYLRAARFRQRVHKSTLHELELPPEPLFEAIRPEKRNNDRANSYRTLACRKLAKEPTFTKMLSALREGAERPARPSIGPTVPGADGKRIPLEQAIIDAEKVGDSALHGFLKKKLEAHSNRDRLRAMDKTLRMRF